MIKEERKMNHIKWSVNTREGNKRVEDKIFKKEETRT